MSDWSKDIDLEVIKEYLQECAENDDYHYEQYQVDIVMHEYIRQKQIIEGLSKRILTLEETLRKANNNVLKDVAMIKTHEMVKQEIVQRLIETSKILESVSDKE